jgi:hypothetical protein
MLSDAIRLIDESLSSRTILVSDAIVSLSKLIIKRTANESLLSATHTGFFAQAGASLNKELLGYEKPDWNLDVPYRQCKAEIVRKINSADSVSYTPLRTEYFIAVWGAQQIESYLSEVMDISVLTTGSDELIAHEVNRLAQTNYIIYTESGISSDLWLRFSIMEIVAIYLQIHAVISELCKVLVHVLEQETGHVFISRNVHPALEARFDCETTIGKFAIMPMFVGP